MALEQSINADSKSKGGVVGITHNQSALQRWFLTAHERASVTTALKEMYAIRDSDRMGTHKESQPKRVQRDEEDVKKLIACFSSNLMTNPFECDADNQLLNRKEVMRQVLLLGLGRKEPITSSKILKSIKKVCRSLVRSPSPRMRSSNVSSLYSASIQPLRKPRQAWTS